MNEVTPPGIANLPIGDTEKARNANANQEIGEPRDEPYWHSRGYLPHFESPVAIQHVTFHLADSLPKSALARLEAELNRLPPEKQDVERRKRIAAWQDAGYGSCVLREPGLAQMTQNTLLFFDGQRYRLLAWVVMPNHVHVLFQPLPGWTVAKIVASWKKFTARKICDYRRALPGIATPGIATLSIGAIGGSASGAQIAIQENGEPRGDSVWQREYWDRYIRDEKHLHQAILYIHQNPVKAGLVATAESWPWSSANPGTANLPIGDISDISDAQHANQEIGEPGGEKL